MSPRSTLTSCGSSSMWVTRRTRPRAPHCPAGTDQDVSGSPCRPSVRSLTISASFPGPTTRTWRNRAGRRSVSRTARAATAASGAVRTTSTAAASTSKARLTARPSGACADQADRRSGTSGMPHTSSWRPPGMAAPSPGSRVARHTSAASARAARSTRARSSPGTAGAHTITRVTRCRAAGPASSVRLSSTSAGISPSSGCSSSRPASCRASGPSPASRARSVSRPRRCAARSAADTATRAAISSAAAVATSWKACPAASQGSSTTAGSAAAAMIRPAWSATRRQIRSRCSPPTDSAVQTSAAYAPASQPGSPVLMTTHARVVPRAATSASGMATAAATAPEVGRRLAGPPSGGLGGAAGADAGRPRGTRPGPAARGWPCTCWDTLTGRPPTATAARRVDEPPAAGPRCGPRGPRRTRSA